jgi:hypothetical protein
MGALCLQFSTRGLREFLQCDPKLQGVLLWLATQWAPAALIVGDIHRTSEEEVAAGGVSGIHTVGPPYRAIDVRVTNLTGDPQVAADNIGALVNLKYVYDPARPDKLVAFTQKHGTGPHVHLQVHANTDFRVFRPGVTLDT